MKLEDIGEFNILKNFLIPSLGDLGSGLGDDCVILKISDDVEIAITSDRGAKPVAWRIDDLKEDYFDAGWLAVVASASDIATTGAKPFALTNNIEAPPSMPVEDLKRYANGVAMACHAFGFYHAGGDLSKAERFSSHCTAIGLLESGYHIGRGACKPGDHVIAIGSMGALVSAYLHAMREGADALSGKELEALLRPKPPIDVMRGLVKAGLITAASDCSDGVIGALLNISSASELGIELTPETIKIPVHVRNEAKKSGISPWNLMFFWGDWQMVATTSDLDRVLKFTHRSNLVTPLGVVVEGRSGLWVRTGEGVREVPEIRNDNFKDKGYMGSFEEHMRYMLDTFII